MRYNLEPPLVALALGLVLANTGALPALAALSSAHGASRGGDGLCRCHDRLLRASATCPLFAPAGG